MSAAVRRLKDTLSSDAIAWKGSLTPVARRKEPGRCLDQ